MDVLAVILLFGGIGAAVVYAVASSRNVAPPPADEAALLAEIQRYRAAIRDGTLCRFCHRANTEGSRYCAECGRQLGET